jgi:hypothetical protein
MSLLLSAILILPALTSRAAWFCRDGTPCPLDCPMLHRAVPAASCCPQQEIETRLDQSAACRGCRGDSCVLQVRPTPDTLHRSDSPVGSDPVRDLPTPLWREHIETSALPAFDFICPPPESPSPVRSSRAPPALLKG